MRANAARPLPLRLRSPLPWLIAAMYTAVAVGYLAMPPVSFDGVTVQTASAQFIGGSLAQSSDTVHLTVCTPLADATSTDARLETVPVTRTAKVRANGSAALDSGDRPTLPALVLNLLGIDWPHAIIAPDLHARKATCAGAPPPRLVAGTEDPALGPGRSPGQAPRAVAPSTASPPIEQTTDARIARLARRYQPTLEVSVADRFWPVSVGAVLADRRAERNPACLVTPAISPACKPVTAVPRPASRRLPQVPDATRTSLPARSPKPAASSAPSRPASTRRPGSLHHWLADPGILDPWARPRCTSTTAGPCTSPASRDNCRRWPTVRRPHAGDVRLRG